ncbi:MAG: CBS domain-containing protein [Hyphomicrobiaceae bacterium]
MKVRDAMHQGVHWVGPDASLRDVALLMRQHDVGSIPIGHDDRLIGMVTDRDIVCNGLANGALDPQSVRARDVMSSGIHTCKEEDELEAAVRHMTDLGIRRLPVIDDNKRMVGMLSLGDVSHAANADTIAHCCQGVAHHHS